MENQKSLSLDTEMNSDLEVETVSTSEPATPKGIRVYAKGGYVWMEIGSTPAMRFEPSNAGKGAKALASAAKAAFRQRLAGDYEKED